MNTDIYPPHTHYAPALHTNVRTMEECTGSIYTVHATHIRTTYKRYTPHTGTQNSHTCTPFTFMQTQTRMHTHTSHTQPYAPMHDKPTTAGLHTVLLPLPSPLLFAHPPLPVPTSLAILTLWLFTGQSPTSPSWIVFCRWNLLTVFCASSLPFFCFLGWRS